MNIKFIKDANTYKEGEEAEVDTLFANAFVAMGFAEVVNTETENKEKPKAKPKTAPKKTTK